MEIEMCQINQALNGSERALELIIVNVEEGIFNLSLRISR